MNEFQFRKPTQNQNFTISHVDVGDAPNVTPNMDAFKMSNSEQLLSNPYTFVAGASAAGAIGGMVGGMMDNAAIRSNNMAIDSAQRQLRRNIETLKNQRLDTINYRKSEANDFLTNYAVLRDPNRSGQIAQMYSSGQERFRSELGQNDQNQLALNSQIAQLEGQRQKPKSGWEIFGQSVGSAANSLIQVAPMLMG